MLHAWSGERLRSLLVVALGLETLAAVAVTGYLAQGAAVSSGLALLMLMVPLAATAVGLVFIRAAPATRFLLLPTALALNLIGLFVLAVDAPSFAYLQCFWSLLSLGAYAGVALCAGDENRISRLSVPLFSLALALVLLTFFIGVSPSGGPHRQWLAIGPFYFEPSELLKLSLTLLLALRLAGPGSSSPRSWVLPAIGVSLAVLAAQGDLGAAFVVAGVGALMIFAATGRWKRLALGLVALTAAGSVAYLLLPYVRLRFSTWLDPWSDPTGASYHVVQSLRALAAGGAFGRGLLAADTVHVPAAHTDSIIAPIGERLGLAGTLVTLALYGMLLAQIRRIYLQARTDLEALLATGVAALLIGQAVLIAGGTSGLLPLTGVTLPLVSYGGSSLLMSYLALGLVGSRNHRHRHGTPAPRRRSHDLVHLALGVALGVLVLWLSVWHLAGTAIIARLEG